jgi:hypothetical protein
MTALLWLLASPAFAQQEICSQAYSRIQFGAAIGKVDDAFRNSDAREAKGLLQQIGKDLLCHDEVVDRLLLGKFGRYMALQFFFEQDEEGARRWMGLAQSAGVDLPFDERVFPPAFVDLVSNLEAPPLGGPDGGLNVPSGGGVFLDGALLIEPKAGAESPHLLQVFDRDQELLGATWQTGAAFEASVLGDVAAPKEPKWWTGDGASSARSKVPATDDGGGGARAPRDGGGFPVVPVVVSGGLVALSGVSYALAASAAGTLPDATSASELTSTRSRANTWVMVSGVSLAGAVGVGVGGFLVSHDGLTFGGRF